MGRTFLVEDDFHADSMGSFPSREEALVLADRLRADPGAEENRPPCTSWRTCRREYYLIEYDDATKPFWTFIRREFPVRDRLRQGRSHVDPRSTRRI
jgi:hypothetical protein